MCSKRSAIATLLTVLDKETQQRGRRTGTALKRAQLQNELTVSKAKKLFQGSKGNVQNKKNFERVDSIAKRFQAIVQHS